MYYLFLNELNASYWLILQLASVLLSCDPSHTWVKACGESSLDGTVSSTAAEHYVFLFSLPLILWQLGKCLPCRNYPPGGGYIPEDCKRLAWGYIFHIPTNQSPSLQHLFYSSSIDSHLCCKGPRWGSYPFRWPQSNGQDSPDDRNAHLRLSCLLCQTPRRFTGPANLAEPW